MIKAIRTWTHENFPKQTQKWWTTLHKTLNKEESLEALSKESVDSYDENMKEGLGILQLLIMKRCPAALEGQWSAILKRISACEVASKKITDYLLSTYSKKDIHYELLQYLASNLQFVTPTTYWLLKE